MNSPETGTVEIKLAKHGYPVLVGHTWSMDMVDILLDEYPHLIEKGYDLDSVVNHIIGGQGFLVDGPAIGIHRKPNGARI